MRYYKIDVVNPQGGASLQSWSSFVNGSTNPNAQNIEIDIPVAPFSIPKTAGAFARVWGVPLKQIAQASDLNGMAISIYGGMQKGLPLANPRQSGLLIQGSIFQAFGNWVGVDQTLDLILAPPFGTITKPANIVHNWQKGTQLSQAIKSALTTAFPGFTVDMNISANLVLQSDDVGYYQTIEQYSTYIQQLSQSILGSKTYPGVMITKNGNKISVLDGSAQRSSVRNISFQDLIGQPTWKSLNVINLKTVMRADIGIGDSVKLPPTLITTTAQSFSQFRQSSQFQGTFMVIDMHHFGNFRQADAESWNTTFDIAQLNSQAG